MSDKKKNKPAVKKPAKKKLKSAESKEKKLPLDKGAEMHGWSMEERYPGITEMIKRFEDAKLPPCPHCGSVNTAHVQVGIIGRTMTIAAFTKKFKLVPNMSDRLGKYFCNECGKYFD
jgi:hypothetical protein